MEYYDDIELDDGFQASDGEGRYERFRIRVDGGQGPLRIDKYLFDKMSGVSRTRIHHAAEYGNVEVNGVTVKSNYKVKPGDDVAVLLGYAPTDYTIVPQEMPLDVVYEDDYVLLINKPAGLVVHPGFGNRDFTLLNGIAWHLREMKDFDANDPSIGLVHRIDKDTSGLILAAKTPAAKADLSHQFFEHSTRRTYNALVWGVLKEDEGTIEGAIARDNRDRQIFRVWDIEENPLAKHAVTHYKVLRRYAYCTLVECRLETGRTHQIRVHMKHIGHPLFNDERYGGSEILKGLPTAKYRQFILNCFDTCPRQALHARTLGFRHPATGEEMDFTSDIAPDMQALLEKWERFNPSMQGE